MARWVEVRVVPGGREEKVTSPAPGRLRITLKAPAREGRANEALIRCLSRHFGVPSSAVRIVRGKTARTKLVQIHEAHA